MSGKNRIMIYGPKEDGTCVVEFRTSEGDVLAISIPRGEAGVIRHFQERCHMDCPCWMIPVPYRGPCVNTAVMSDLLLRRVSEGRVGVEAPDDYDVIGADGSVIGRIFKTAIPGTGTSWAWRLTRGGTRGPRLRADPRGRDGGVR
jgi:hypothetical protein